MQFVYPYFLFGLFLISIPVIIHLFNFRKFKKIYFSNILFICKLKQETQKESKIRHLLVLFSRILTIACLVFAFAQPYIPISENKHLNQKNSTISIYIDNSFSMNALSDNGILFEQAKNKSLEIANTYKSSDLFQILTNDFQGRHQRFVSKEEFINMLEDIHISPCVKNISEVVLRQKDLLYSKTSKNKISYIISDFQKNITDINNLANDTNINVYFIPVIANRTNNLYIDSCWFDSPVLQLEQNVKLIARIKNNSDDNLEKIPVKLSINNTQRAIASFNINANSETEIILQYTIHKTGIQNGVLEITDYPITYDNSFYFSYLVSKNIPILSINETNENIYLNSLFGKDSAFTFANFLENNLDYSSFSNYKLIILNELKYISSGLAQQLKLFVNDGGSIIIFPNAEINLESYHNFLISVNASYYTKKDTVNTKIEKINLDHEIYNDVFEKIPENIDLPTVFSYYILNKTSHSNSEYLLKMQNGNDFLTVEPTGKGKIYLSAVALEPQFSNFVKHSIFVPSMYKIALLSENQSKLFYTIGEDALISLQNINVEKENIFKIKKNVNSNFEIIPEYKNINSRINIFTHNQLKEAGNYYLYAGKDKIQGISYNYDRKESNIECYKINELTNLTDKAVLNNYFVLDFKNKPLSQVLTQLNQGIRLWKLFIILALIFLAIEIVLLRFFKI